MICQIVSLRTRQEIKETKIDTNKTRSLETGLNSWGNVNLVMVVFTGDKTYPAILLTNDNNDIIYEFSKIWNLKE